MLLLDEPFGALDAKVRKELRRWLRKLHDELHVTSIFVTHDQEEALEVADRVVLMNKGRVEQVGTPADVYERPATSFVYGFLGAVNLFHGRVEGEHVRVGEVSLPHDGRDAVEGSDVVAFARPHELEILTDTDTALGVEAIVSRVLTFGSAVRVELDAMPDAAARGEPDHYEVVLARERANQLALEEGQRVRVAAANLRVFPRATAA